MGMRTIKFRGKRIDNSEWVIGDLCSMFNENNLCIMPKSFFATRDLGEREDDERIKLDEGFAIGAFYSVKPETVGQFTGLLDKKGKEIYEGDILNIGASSFGFINDNDGKSANYEVQIDGCDFVLFRQDLKLKWGRLSRIDELGWESEVIGTIYEITK